MANTLPGDVPHMSTREREFGEAMWQQILEYVTSHPDIEVEIRKVDNTTRSYRDPKEKGGNLYVLRSPYETRIPSHTGVDYAFDQSTKTFSLRLNNPTHLPEYERKHLRLDTNHKLCQACLDALNYYCRYRGSTGSSKVGNKPRSLPNAVIHHFNLWSLVVFANIDKCYVCQKLLEQLQRRFAGNLNPANYELFDIQICWQLNCEPEEYDRLKFVVTKPSLPRTNQWSQYALFHMDLWPLKAFSAHFSLPPVINSSLPISNRMARMSIDAAEKTNTGSERSRALARTWFSECLFNATGKHRECNKRDSNYLPSRLLDVRHAQKTSLLRIVSTAIAPEAFSEDRDYISLSHCWGAWGAGKNPLLKQENLVERHQSGLRLSELPKTYRDAVEIARWFDVRWLWIDSLCIIQDSAQDWYHEASLMSQTYQNAVFNISADVGKDSRAGCFVERDTLDITPVQIHSVESSRDWALLPADGYLFLWTQETPSFSRAWIHREKQLARRVLHFTQKEMLWECCGTEGASFASEMFPGGAPFKDFVFGQDSKYQAGRLQQGLEAGAEETVATWNDVCERISSKKLTNPSDMPVVLSGVARDFSRFLPDDEYVAGLWRSTLPHSLLWYSGPHKSEGLPYIAPSWSWLSTDSPVILANRGGIEKELPIMKVLEIRTTLKYNDPDPYGPLQSGVLEIEGYLRRIEIVFPEPGSTFILKATQPESAEGNAHLYTIGSSWDQYSGDLIELTLDTNTEGGHLDCFCLFITISESWYGHGQSHRDLKCLLLEQTPDKSNTFSRLGTLTLRDLPALKMRYEKLDDSEGHWLGIQTMVETTRTHIISKKKEGAESAKNDENGKRDTEFSEENDKGALESSSCLDMLYRYDSAIKDVEGLKRLKSRVLDLI